MEKGVKQLTAKQAETETRITTMQNEHEQTKEDLDGKIQYLSTRLDQLSSHEDRITKLEDDMADFSKELTKAKDDGKVDYDRLCSKDEYLSLVALIREI